MIRRTRQKGFTLLEVLIALFILAGAIMVLASAWSGNFMRMRKSILLNDAATLLERKMLETEAKYKDKVLSEIPDHEDGDFGSEQPRYRWVMTSKDLKLPDLSPLLIGQEDGADEMLISMIKQVSEYLSQAIKEVKVSIFVKSKFGKDLEFSAVQYFMDYSKDFNIGGAAGAAGAGGAGAGAGAGAGGGTPTAPTPVNSGGK